MELSARNQIRGTVIAVRIEGIMAEVTLDVSGQFITSTITRASAERLGVKLGDEVVAFIKASDVMIGK